MPMIAHAAVHSTVRHNSQPGSSHGHAKTEGVSSGARIEHRASWRDKIVEQEAEESQRLLASDPRLQDARGTAAVQMLKACEFSSLTIGDVQHLFKVLGADTDYLEFEHFRTLLTVVLDPPLIKEEVVGLWNLSRKRPDGHISVEEMYAQFQAGNIMHKIDDLHRANTHSKKSCKDDKPLVNRELFKTWVAWRNNRDDAFRTLPIAVTYLLVFVLLVMCHLQIVEREMQEHALENWVVGWSRDWEGPYLHDHVTSVGFWHYWLQESGMPCLFSDARRNDAGYAFIHMASSSLMVGDAKLVRVPDGGGREEVFWMLNSDVGERKIQEERLRAAQLFANGDFESSRAVEAQIYQSAALARLAELSDSGVFHYEAEEMRLEWVTYNQRTRMFAINKIRVVFKGTGYIVPSMSSTAVMIEPYPRHQIVRCVFIWTLCGLYCLLILIPLWEEGKEMIFSLKVGLSGFINYWGFWNGVDWCTLLMGLSVVGVWINCCMNMRSDAIQSLIDDDYYLNPTVMALTKDQIQKVLDDLGIVSRFFFILQIIMAVNTVTILLKLFKAFQSNARLNVVTDTMIIAATDIIHFLIVFMVIFMGWSMMAHVLFGNDLKEFESFGTSMMTAFCILMGDFGWYVDFQSTPSGLGSGMPRAVMTIWYLSYQIFVLLCLLNMLLAVILERYAQVSGALEGSAEAPTLWVQVGRYFERRKATKGFIPLVSISTALEMTGSKAVHSGENVTETSIVDAFPGMKPEQAKWLMKYLEKEAKARAPQESFDDIGEKLGNIEVFVKSLAEELHIVQICGLLTSRKVDDLEEQMLPANPAVTDDQLFSKVESLLGSAGEQLQEQAAATDELNAMIQELANTTQKLSMRPPLEEKLKDGSFSKASGPKMLPPCCASDEPYNGPATAPRSLLNQQRPISTSFG